MQFPLHITAAFLKRSYAKRTYRGWWKVLASVAVIVLMWIADESGSHTGPLMIFAMSMLTLYVVLCVIAWFRQLRAIKDWLRMQGEVPVIYSLSEETVEASSAIGSTKLKWDAFKKITVSDFDTLLVFSYHGALTLPTAQVPKEALDLLKTRFAAHGKKVEDKRKLGTQSPSSPSPPLPSPAGPEQKP